MERGQSSGAVRDSCEACAVCRRVVRLHGKGRWFFFSVALKLLCCVSSSSSSSSSSLEPFVRSLSTCNCLQSVVRVDARADAFGTRCCFETKIEFHLLKRRRKSSSFGFNGFVPTCFFPLFLRATQFWLIRCGLSINNCLIRVCLMHRFVLNRVVLQRLCDWICTFLCFWDMLPRNWFDNKTKVSSSSVWSTFQSETLNETSCRFLFFVVAPAAAMSI